MIAIQLLWALLSFFLGSLPFSVWVGRLGARRDIREVGDRNPGATNVLRAGGFLWFTLALLLDISKAAAPVGLAVHVFGWEGWPVWLIAMAPPLGHAFSPFLGGKGGKAVAAAFGVWIGLTIWWMPLVALLSLIFWFALLTISGWAVVLTLVTMLAYLVFFQPDPLLIAVAAGQLALMTYTHRADLARRPSLRLLRGEKKAADQAD